MRKKLFSFMLMAVGLLISTNSWAGNVAKIGDTEYASLSALTTAFESLPDGVETEVTILSDIEFTSASYDGWGYNMPIPAGKNIKLNLGEYFLINKATNNYCNAAVPVKGTLTIEATTGGIKAGNCPAFAMYDGAQLIINGGVYTEDGGNSRYALITTKNSNYNSNPIPTITINGGTFSGQENYRMGTIMHIENKCNININGGDFSTISKGTTSQGNQWGLIVVTSSASESNVTITDGKFDLQYGGTGTQPNSSTFACVDYRSKKGTLAISGGEFTNLYQCSDGSQTCCALYVYDQTERVEITGGTFKSHGYAARIKAYNAGVDKAAVQNANFISETGCALLFCSFSNNETYNINGGTYQGKSGISVFGNTKATVNINDCSINATTCGIQCQGLSEVNILGGSIESQKIGVQYAQGSYSSADGIINIGGSASIKAGTYGVYNDKGTINITGGRIWGETNSVFNVKYLECAGLQGTVEVTGGVFNNRPVPEDYIIRTETPSSAPRRAASGQIIGGGDGSSPDGPPAPPTPPCDESIQDGNATILGVGLDVITNPDETTYNLGYHYAVGRQEGKTITPTETTIDWGTNTTWTDGDNNVVPTITDNVEIPAGKQVVVGMTNHTDAVAYGLLNLGDLTVETGNSLTVAQILKVQNEAEQGGELGKVIVKPGARLTVGNAQDVDALNIVLKDDGENGTGVMLFNPKADVKDVYATIELHTTARHEGGEYIWNYIGIPLKLAAGQFTADSWSKTAVNSGDQDLGTYWQKWDIVEGWKSVGLEAVEPFKGFAITNESSEGVVYTFKGTLVGNQNKPMNFNHKGFNFFANSYTAPIDIEELLNDLSSNVRATIYMFDSENNQFKSVSKSAFEGFIPPAFRVIPSMNGFFILMDEKNSAQESVNYANAVYNAALGNRPIYTPARQEELEFSRVRININSTTGRQDAMYLVENSDFTDDFENGYDEVKYMNSGLNVFANTAYGDQSAVFSDDLEGTIISMNATNDQVFTLSFDEQVGDLYTLTDIVTGKQVTMDANSTYTFTADAQNMGQRFMVTKANSISTDMECVKSAAKKSGVYSITGQYFGKTVNMNALPKGVYIINGIKVVK